MTWTFEQNGDGKWALFLRAGGTVTRMSDWWVTLEALRAAVAAQFGLRAEETPDVEPAGRVEANDAELP